MRTFTLSEYAFQTVFTRGNAGTYQEYWFAPTVDRDGWIVVWFDEQGREQHLHTYRYPPDVWGE